MVKCWVKCDMCDDFICNRHNKHAYDCKCPPIEVWLEHGLTPYDNEVEEARGIKDMTECEKCGRELIDDCEVCYDDDYGSVCETCYNELNEV